MQDPPIGTKLLPPRLNTGCMSADSGMQEIFSWHYYSG